MTKIQEPTTNLSKARRWFKDRDLVLEKERGACYVRINKYLSIQITKEEVDYRAQMYDLDSKYRFDTTSEI